MSPFLLMILHFPPTSSPVFVVNFWWVFAILTSITTTLANRQKPQFIEIGIIYNTNKQHNSDNSQYNYIFTYKIANASRQQLGLFAI